MEYRIISLDEQTWRIEEFNDNNHVYMYLLEGSEKAILLDAGFGTIKLDKVVRSITELPVEVVLTHGHVDHIGGTGFFEKVFLHKADKEVYRLHCGERCEEIFLGGEKRILPPKEEVYLIEEDFCWDLGGRMLKVISAFGHTKGSICIWDESRKWLFTGDTCCQGHVLLNLAYATNVEIYLDTIKNLLKIPFETTWPAHHTLPVGKDILQEFEEAARLLMQGKAESKVINHVNRKAREFCWKRIGIVYPFEYPYGEGEI